MSGIENAAADRWCADEATAREVASALSVGDYVCRWGDAGVDDVHALGDSVMREIDLELRKRDLTTESDDAGVRVVAREGR